MILKVVQSQGMILRHAGSMEHLSARSLKVATAINAND